MAESTYDKFRKLLAELFMFDRADLDFGIYRIMNAKRDEVTRFFDNDLLPQVKTTLGEVDSGQRQQLQVELEEAEKAAGLAGFNPDDSPRVQDLRQALKAGGDPEVLEAEVFSHLYSFFRRYYKDGDFISLRRYKEGVYAIPYEGEEVKLYWANHDQYYIKSGEYFRDYAFRLPDGRRVHFKLVQADEERDNTKAAAGQERRFILSETEAVREEDCDLVIPFEYRPDAQKRKREELIAEATLKVLSDEAAAAWLSGLAAPAPTEKKPKRTLLEKHLNDYTARNSFDYFIHKDLGGFLRRELDFYIKNEVMHLDDIESEGEKRVIQYLAKIKAIRRLAHKIIDFLTQLEDFQKKLWLKKKFVIETNYCVTLDRVPEELYTEIAANEAQREEWVRLFAIDEIEGDLTQPGYSEPMTLEFLKTNQSLLVNTTHFDREFTDRLLASFDNRDGQTDGLLVHGDNFQAFRILFATLNERVKCIYLDPPYNTSEETFVYKNSYQHSSWLAMMADRAGATARVLAEDGVLMVTIDDEEAYRLKMLLDAEIGSDRYIGTVVIQSNPRGRGINSHFATCHEYCLCYAHDPALASIVDSPLTDAQADGYRHGVGDSKYRLLPFRRSGGLSTPDDRPKSEFAIFYSPSAGVIVGIGGQRLFAHPAEYQTDTVYIHHEGAAKAIALQEFQQRTPADTVAIMPVDSAGQRRVWRWSDREKILRSVVDGDFVVQEGAGRHSVQLKDYIKEGRKPRTIWNDSRYDSSSHGTNLLKDMLGSRRSFGYPKSLWSTRDALHAVVGDDEEAIVMDLFGGSGTTAHAVIDLNRTDGGHRQYVLAEAESYFGDVLLPRVLKAIYSATWRDGKPEGSRSHLSHALKYVVLESYEDALNNLTLRRTEDQDQLLDQHADLREDYTLRYLLDVETEGSASLLDLDQFEDPLSYTLQVGQGSVGETRPVAVDLVETFNYLIGLRVKHSDAIRGFRVVEGASPQGERVLVIWRNTREKSNADLDEFFQKQGYNTRDTEFDVIYVNGDNNLENLRRPDETWKVRLIEDDFKRLMFDVEDV